MAHHYIKISERIIEPPFIILKPEVTEKEYFEYATEDVSCELIDGMLIIHSPASLEHEKIFKFLLFLLDRFLKKTKQGEVIGSRFVMRLEHDLILEPDLIIILSNSISKLKETYLDGPADFIIEILSPATKENDLTRKIPRCLRKGVKEIWAIDPILQKLIVFIPEKESKEYQGNKIVKSIIIKDFWINLKWIWRVNDHDPLDCFNEIIKNKQ